MWLRSKHVSGSGSYFQTVMTVHVGGHVVLMLMAVIVGMYGLVAFVHMQMLMLVGMFMDVNEITMTMCVGVGMGVQMRVLQKNRVFYHENGAGCHEGEGSVEPEPRALTEQHTECNAQEWSNGVISARLCGAQLFLRHDIKVDASSELLLLIILVQLFSKPQQTQAARTNREPSLKEKLPCPSKLRMMLASVTRKMASQRRFEMTS